MLEATEWFGVATAAGLFSTIVLGLLFRRGHLRVFAYHRACGVATVIVGACHGALALLSAL